LHDENSRADVTINLRFSQSSRTSLDDLKSLNLKGTNGNLVPLSSLVKTETAIADTSIYHKNLQPVVYVLGDVSGRVESSVYAMLNLQPQIDFPNMEGDSKSVIHLTCIPAKTRRLI